MIDLFINTHARFRYHTSGVCMGPPLSDSGGGGASAAANTTACVGRTSSDASLRLASEACERESRERRPRDSGPGSSETGRLSLPPSPSCSPASYSLSPPSLPRSRSLVAGVGDRAQIQKRRSPRTRFRYMHRSILALMIPSLFGDRCIRV